MKDECYSVYEDDASNFALVLSSTESNFFSFCKIHWKTKLDNVSHVDYVLNKWIIIILFTYTIYSSDIMYILLTIIT